jgi:integrase
MAEGIEVRVAGDGTKSYRAAVWSQKEQRRLRKTFPTMAAAKAWRSEAATAIKAGRMRASLAPRFEDVFGRTVDGRWEDGKWIDGALAGTIRTRGRQPFKESSVRAVRQHYQRRLEEPFGKVRLDQVTHVDLQEFVDHLETELDKRTGKPIGPSTIEGTILPLRLAYRWARGKGLVTVDPTDGLELPQKARGTRVPPSPADAAALLATVPDEDRALWGTAMLAGLRRGELLGLLWTSVDLKNGILTVDRSWNPDGGVFTAPKSRQGRRKIPIGSQLAPLLKAHALATGRREGLVFGQTATRPPRPETVQARADKAWETAGLERVTLHACRHLYASMSIAGGVNANALCTYMGHSGIQVTYDLYGHLFPGNEAEASALLDNYLARTFVRSGG